MGRNVGFVGLGVMGAPMAAHLVRAGHKVTVWNRTAAKAEPLRDLGAQVSPHLPAMAEACDLIFLCVGRTQDVQGCLQLLTPSARKGTLFVDHSTISPDATEVLHERLAHDGFLFLDAPITGGSVGAQNGQLTIFCGGTPEAFEDALPYMQAYAKRAERVGGPGAGQMTKMANQIAVAGSLLGMAEALVFAEKAGLDVNLTQELLSGGAAGSWTLTNYAPKAIKGDWSPGFSIDNQLKDFGYCDETAQTIDAAIPMTRLAERILRKLQAQGHGAWATAAAYKAYQEMGAED